MRDKAQWIILLCLFAKNSTFSIVYELYLFQIKLIYKDLSFNTPFDF